MSHIKLLSTTPEVSQHECGAANGIKHPKQFGYSRRHLLDLTIWIRSKARVEVLILWPRCTQETGVSSGFLLIISLDVQKLFSSPESYFILLNGFKYS